MSQNQTSTQRYEGFVRLALATPFGEYLRKRNVDLGPAFESVGLAEADWENPELFVHAEIVYGLVNAFAEVAGDKFLGLHVGEQQDFSKWPPFAAAFASSHSLIEFFASFIKSVPNDTNAVEHSLIIEPSSAVYRVHRLHLPNVEPIQITGFGCAQYIQILRSVTGPLWDPSKVTFETRYIAAVPPAYAGFTIKFIPDPGLNVRFPLSWLFQDIQVDIGRGEGPAERAQDEVTVVAALRSVVQNHLDQKDLGAAQVSKLLGLQADRLAKALKQHGTTLPREIKRLKIDRAKEMLQGSDQPIAQIGSSIGYTDNAHFTRFFRSQTGISPKEFRQRSRRGSEI